MKIRSTAPRMIALVVVGCTAMTACSSASTSAPTPPASGAPTIAGTEVIARGLETPWGMAFLPDGSALVTERDTGIINRISPKPGEDATVEPVGRVPSSHESESGLLGIALEPVTNPKRAFVFYTTPEQGQIATMRWDGDSLSDLKPILTGIPSGPTHDGGRLVFGPDGYLYASTGDAGVEDTAQDPDSLGGKILRITTAGQPAPGNPFPGSPVYSMGHRNVQGLAFDDRARLWSAEFGSNLQDELNLIEKGSNYGWPLQEGKGGNPKFADPFVQWPPAEASPSGVAIVGEWAYVAALRGERLWQVGIAGPEPIGPFALLVEEYGRLRTPMVAPDGTIWLTTSNTDGRGNPAADDDKIIRLRLT